MALSPLVEKMLAQMIQQPGPMLSPLAPVGQMALAAALAAREKRGRKEDEQKVAGLAETLASLTAPGADQFVPQGVMGNTGPSGPDPLATAPADILKRTPGAQAGIASMGVPIVTQTPEDQAGGARSRLADAYTKLAAGSPDALQQVLMKTMFPDPGEGYTLGPDETRFNSRGDVVAKGGPKTAPTKVTNLTGEVFQNGAWRAGSVNMGSDGSMYTSDTNGNRINIEPGQFRAGDKSLVSIAVGGTDDPAYLAAFKSLDTERAKLDTARGQFLALNRAEKLLSDGNLITGSGAQLRTGVENLAVTLGIANPERITNTQELMGLMGSSVMQIIKGFGTGQSQTDADREYAKLIAGADPALQIQSMQKLIKIAKTVSSEGVSAYNKRRNAFVGASKSPISEAALPVFEIPSGEENLAPESDDPELEAARRWRQQQGF